MSGSAAAEAEAEKGAGGGVEITELEKFEPTRVDGVRTPANGFPILMMKSVAAPEPPTAQPAAGVEKADGAPAGCGCGPDCACCAQESAKAAKAKKPKHAKKAAKASAGGKANKGAILTIEDLKKSGLLITPDVIKSAVTEAVKSAEERIDALADELAKVKAMPIPGGPQLVTTQSQRQAGQNPSAEKAARYRAIAAKASDPDVRASYNEAAAQLERATPKD